VAWLVVPPPRGFCLFGYFDLGIRFIKLAFTVGPSKIWLPLYSGLPKWTSCYPISTDLHDHKDLSSVCTAQMPVCISSCNHRPCPKGQCHVTCYTNAPWPTSYAGATAITGILTQSLVTVAVIWILHRWLSKFSPSMGFEHPTYHLEGWQPDHFTRLPHPKILILYSWIYILYIVKISTDLNN